MPSHKILRKFKYHHPEIFGDDAIVYKSSGNWLIVLKKSTRTKTNEKRNGIVNAKNAKYRANRLRVLKIINKCDPKITTTNIHSSWDLKTLYQINRITYPDSFDTNLDNVCSSGIHYYKNFMNAYFYHIFP